MIQSIRSRVVDVRQSVFYNVQKKKTVREKKMKNSKTHFDFCEAPSAVTTQNIILPRFSIPGPSSSCTIHSPNCRSDPVLVDRVSSRTFPETWPRRWA